MRREEGVGVALARAARVLAKMANFMVAVGVYVNRRMVVVFLLNLGRGLWWSVGSRGCWMQISYIQGNYLTLPYCYLKFLMNYTSVSKLIFFQPFFQPLKP